MEGHDAYKIRLTFNNNAVRHVWIDAQSFLEVKMEEPPRILNGRPHAVWTFYRDYRDVQGLKIPFLLETAVQDVIGSQKLIIEKVELNPKLADTEFGKPKSLPAAALRGHGPAPVIRNVPPIKR